MTETELQAVRAREKAATAQPWEVCSPETVAMNRRVLGEQKVPEGVSIIERPPQSRSEAMDAFFHGVLVGWLSPQDAAWRARRRACTSSATSSASTG